MMSTVMLAVSADSYADAAGGAYRQAYRMNMTLDLELCPAGVYYGNNAWWPFE